MTTETIAHLLAECVTRGIQLIPTEGDGLTIDAPQCALIPDWIRRLKTNKIALLEILQRDAHASAYDSTYEAAMWQAALDRLEGDTLFPADVLDALRASDVAWSDDDDREERIAIALEGCGRDPATIIEPPRPCSECGSLELWQTVAGAWRCLHCDPCTQGPRLREQKSEQTMNGKR